MRNLSNKCHEARLSKLYFYYSAIFIRESIHLHKRIISLLSIDEIKRYPIIIVILITFYDVVSFVWENMSESESLKIRTNVGEFPRRGRYFNVTYPAWIRKL